jgi:UDP-glucuronate 4-epimerase
MTNRDIPPRVVVTGGAGFIGSHLVDNLLERGSEVVAIDSFDPFYDPRVKRDNIAAARRNPSFRLIEADIRDTETLDASLGDVPYHAFIHLAAAVGVRPSIVDPGRYVKMNVEGTAAALALAERKRVGLFLFGSSSSVYGDSASVPFVESDPAVSPISPYAATKRAGELLCHSAHHLSGLSVMCLRFFTVYGPRQRPDLAIHKFVSMIEKQEPLTIYGDGQTRRDYTHVTDIVAGICSALEYAAAGKQFEIVNLGGGQPVTVTELVALLEKLLGKKAALQWLPAQDGDVRQTFASTEKASRLLRFKPTVGLEDGLRAFLEWYRRSG